MRVRGLTGQRREQVGDAGGIEREGFLGMLPTAGDRGVAGGVDDQLGPGALQAAFDRAAIEQIAGRDRLAAGA